MVEEGVLIEVHVCTYLTTFWRNRRLLDLLAMM